MRRRRGLIAAAATALLASAGVVALPAAPAVAVDSPYDVLVFSKTAAFRHASIPTGVQAIRNLGTANGFTVTTTEDATTFTVANLAKYEAVVFLSTTGDVLNPAQQTAFESYIRGGGGFFGIHAAADTEYDWAWYGGLVGAYFQSHPAQHRVTVKVEDRATAATSALPEQWIRSDELYNYRTNPRSVARVLATLDESSYPGGTMGADHPIMWCQNYDGGRSFYTGLGHTDASYAEPNFRATLLGGIRYAAGRTKIDCRPDAGYTTLYAGTTTGWSHAGPGSVTSADATLTTAGGLGLYWYSAAHYASYSLRLNWKAAGDDNSGVFIGFPASSDPNSAVNNGYEVQIDATDVAARTTGSVYSVQSADLAARDAALNPPGEWNAYELVVQGERLRVYLNGVQINDFTNTDGARSLAGYIGLQNHGNGDDVSFRNVRIKALPAPRITGIGGACVDVPGSIAVVALQLATCTGSPEQTWTRTGQTERALGNCMDVRGASAASGAVVQLHTCNGTAAQVWTPNADGTLRNPNSGKCLDTAAGAAAVGTPLQIQQCTASASQQWRLS